MKHNRFLVLLILVLPILAACYPPAGPATPAADTSTGSGTPDTIVGIVWQWASVTDQTTRDVSEVPDPASYTIVFNADGILSGQADCNSFSGVYSQKNGFSITVGAITEMYCGDTSLDQQYLQLLGGVAAGGLDGAGNLALETAGGAQRMLFRNGGPATAP